MGACCKCQAPVEGEHGTAICGECVKAERVAQGLPPTIDLATVARVLGGYRPNPADVVKRGAA